MRKSLAIAVLAGSVLATAANGQLVDITQPNTRLSDVIGRQFQVGDKLFSVPANGFASARFNANEIFISAITAADPSAGIGFRLTGAWNDAPGNGSSGFTFAYDVEITPSGINNGNRITNSILRFNGAASGPGSFARISETVMDSNNTLLDNNEVFANGDGSARHQDQSTFNNVTRLRLVKDVIFFAGDTGNNGGQGTASASFVDQTFGQVNIIPLPLSSSLALLGLGLTAISRRR